MTCPLLLRTLLVIAGPMSTAGPSHRPRISLCSGYPCTIDTIPTRNGRELGVRWAGKVGTNSWDQTGRGCCLVRTQHSFCTQQLRYVGITRIVILFGLNLCAETRENSFQEVLEAVLFGVGVYLQQLTFWLSCGSPIRVSTTFILCVKLILFELARISNNV